VLGGAPFNVTWALRGFRRNPLLVSAVGRDAQGESILEQMRTWGLSTEGIYQNNELATGTVEVRLIDNEPEYKISHPRAWDAIPACTVEVTELLYHGSLALRDERNGASFESLTANSPAKRFYDINLRAPYDTLEIVEKWLHCAEWVKLNLDELARLVGKPIADMDRAEPWVAQLREKFTIGNVLLTAGQQGALIRGVHGNASIAPAPRANNFQDAVGAGDAFTAVTIDGILSGHSAEAIIHSAAHFAAKVCGLRGATSNDKEFYQTNFDHA
jgi:fructokinase